MIFLIRRHLKDYGLIPEEIAIVEEKGGKKALADARHRVKKGL